MPLELVLFCDDTLVFIFFSRVHAFVTPIPLLILLTHLKLFVGGFITCVTQLDLQNCCYGIENGYAQDMTCALK